MKIKLASPCRFTKLINVSLMGCLIWAIVTSVSHLFAQQLGQQGTQRDLQTVEFKGILQGVRGNILGIKRDDGSNLLVQIPQDRGQIRYERKLKPNQVQAGWLLRTIVPYEVLQKQPLVVKNVEVYSLPEVKSEKPRSPLEKAHVTIGLHPLSQIGNDRESKEVLVVGVTLGLKNNNVLVNVGKQIEIDLSGDVEIINRSRLLTVAQPGDTVSGFGLAHRGQSNQIAASSLVVTGAPKDTSPLDEFLPSKKKRDARSNAELEP